MPSGCSQSKDFFKKEGFYRTGDMTAPRMNHAAVLLSDGRVLITGGINYENKNSLLSSAEIYDPTTGTFTKVPDMTRGRQSHQLTLLQDGRVLITGGVNTASAEIYDPKTNTFIKTGDMNICHSNHAAILLSNGKVLIIGGNLTLKPPIPPNIIERSFLNPEVKKYMHYGELYDPVTGEFTLTPAHKGWYACPAVTMLPNGKVFLAGDYNTGKMVEIYDPTKNEFIKTGDTPQISYQSTMTLLDKYKVLVFLGFDNDFTISNLYNINTGKFKQLRSKIKGRCRIGNCTATSLKNGKVLFIGIDDKETEFNALYLPAIDTFIKTQQLRKIFHWHTATKLNNGDVLITGGFGKDKRNENKFEVLKEASLYKY